MVLIAAGVSLALVGLLVQFGWLSWFGHLPGDIKVDREGVRIYFPVVSMIVASLVLSGLLNLIRRIL